MDPEAGLLLYLKTGQMYPVPAKHLDKRGETVCLFSLLAPLLPLASGHDFIPEGLLAVPAGLLNCNL